MQRHNGAWWSYWVVYLAKRNRPDILTWGYNQNWPQHPTLVCASAARGGHVDLLQWCRAQGWVWDATTCAGAAECEQWWALQWALEHGAPPGRFRRAIPDTDLRPHFYCAQRWLQLHYSVIWTEAGLAWLKTVDDVCTSSLNLLGPDLTREIKKYC